MKLLALLMMTVPTIAFADGPGLDYPIDDPCDTPMQTEAEYKAGVFSGDPEEFWQMALKLRAARCGDVEPPPEPWEEWEAKGFTDAELMAAIFNGTRVPPADPSPIPLPAAGLLLLSGLGFLFATRRSA